LPVKEDIMSTNDRYLYRIADDIDRHGVRAVERDVQAIVDDARRAGQMGAALDVLGDVAEPEIARARAFGIVATRLWRHGRALAEHAGPATPALV
jgi:hypothetical protein